MLALSREYPAKPERAKRAAKGCRTAMGISAMSD
jgi:hypothetical protein